MALADAINADPQVGKTMATVFAALSEENRKRNESSEAAMQLKREAFQWKQQKDTAAMENAAQRLILAQSEDARAKALADIKILQDNLKLESEKNDIFSAKEAATALSLPDPAKGGKSIHQRLLSDDPKERREAMMDFVDLQSKYEGDGKTRTTNVFTQVRNSLSEQRKLEEGQARAEFNAKKEARQAAEGQQKIGLTSRGLDLREEEMGNRKEIALKKLGLAQDTLQWRITSWNDKEKRLKTDAELKREFEAKKEETRNKFKEAEAARKDRREAFDYEKFLNEAEEENRRQTENERKNLEQERLAQERLQSRVNSASSRRATGEWFPGGKARLEVPGVGGLTFDAVRETLANGGADADALAAGLKKVGEGVSPIGIPTKSWVTDDVIAAWKKQGEEIKSRRAAGEFAPPTGPAAPALPDKTAAPAAAAAASMPPVDNKAALDAMFETKAGVPAPAQTPPVPPAAVGSPAAPGAASGDGDVLPPLPPFQGQGGAAASPRVEEFFGLPRELLMS